MTQWTLADVSEAMRDIDFTMLFTRTDDGSMAGRPMSNNRDVEYQGDSYFFSYDTARTVRDIARDPTVSMALQGKTGLLGRPPVFIAVEGQAELIRDKGQFADHWTDGLDRWFEQGIDTSGLVLIKVHATRIHYWHGEDEGDIPTVPMEVGSVSAKPRLIYASANGDRWSLIAVDGVLKVLHEPNQSGGLISEVSLDAFVAADEPS